MIAVATSNNYARNKKFVKKMLSEVMQKIEKRNVRIAGSSIDVQHEYAEKIPEKFGDISVFELNGKTSITITIKLRKIGK